MTHPAPRTPPVDPTLAELGARIRARREELGLSQEAAAERAAMHTSNYARIERGQQGPRVQLLLLLAEALETTPGVLLDGLPLPQLVVEEVVVTTRTRRRPGD
ncbi:helix-turn-helix domain-containing protein [Tsukamurella tyrosinosolvens]|uniref:helix-turn-helix domain-containing protein n=1 Tax=Tsukamurella tyrosinosolvens TaxID=57704 RepID=UPI000C7F0508|nr:helix-turn-helix transcriptional regulator [Tsukamurella tyrosinosolvens]AUN42735.1 hypothetical protein ASU32_00335 [Tsukamurella tyrosinosolvens]